MASDGIRRHPGIQSSYSSDQAWYRDTIANRGPVDQASRVRNDLPAEDELQATGVIPDDLSTHTVVLSDIEFDAEPEPGEAARVGYNVEGKLKSWAELKEHCESRPITFESKASCRAVKDGKYPLVNGLYTGMFEAVGMLAHRGEGIRLRLINTSTNRHYRLKLLENGDDNNLYRIGGEGGFLEFVRREGGMRVDRTDRCDIAFRGETVVNIINSGGVGNMIEWTLLAVDDSGNSSTQTCTVEVVRKKDL